MYVCFFARKVSLPKHLSGSLSLHQTETNNEALSLASTPKHYKSIIKFQKQSNKPSHHLGQNWNKMVSWNNASTCTSPITQHESLKGWETHCVACPWSQTFPDSPPLPVTLEIPTPSEEGTGVRGLYRPYPNFEGAWRLSRSPFLPFQGYALCYVGFRVGRYILSRYVSFWHEAAFRGLLEGWEYFIFIFRCCCFVMQVSKKQNNFSVLIYLV